MTFAALTAILMGIGLAATAGFRIFIPLLIGSLAIRGGMVQPSEGFMWIASDTALILFSVATVLEVGAYYIPWIDNLLDTVASPAAVIAGILLTAAFIGEANEIFRWAVAIIAGGGAAGVVQAATVALRGGSAATTGGVANPVVSTGELGASVIGGVLALFAPIVVIVLTILLVVLIVRLVQKRKAKRAQQEAEVAVI